MAFSPSEYRGANENAIEHAGDALARKNAELVAPQGDPRKMENHHDLMGLISLLQGRHSQAVEHYRKADHSRERMRSPARARDVHGTGMAVAGLVRAAFVKEIRRGQGAQRVHELN
ncbi:MAG: hypothetical protein ACRETX_11795, partial [Steroidobacteraceae bacterium]